MERSVRAALAAATSRLAAVSGTPRLDAELLMAEALGVTRETMLLSRLDDAAPALFETLLARRLAHEPVAYITGRRGFWTIELEVGPAVLIPRPDSETLIEAAVERFGTGGPRTVLDLGTGSGALLLAALDEWPAATGHGRDASPDALAVAARNAARLGLAERATFSLGDWGAGLDGPFDLILANPPYVAAGAELPADVAGWEPEAALYAGTDGCEDHRRLAPEIARLLAPGGLACVEIGFTQAEAAGILFARQGLEVVVRKDLAGRDRCLLLRR
ncbi:MAG TPA: peptide chain release factor N(5)-glutamine methyltransferase [Allosphingosinicella sp.]